MSAVYLGETRQLHQKRRVVFAAPNSNMQQKPVAGSGCNDVCEFKLFVNLALGRRLRLESESQGRQASNSGVCPTDLAPTILQRSVATFSYGTVLARDLPISLVLGNSFSPSFCGIGDDHR